jgi:indolepyruvate ferredoxin oxidoreductase beta subunit
VLSSWIVDLAAAEGWPVQSTSIPGVAQRTGATTYYIEILPFAWTSPETPVLALTPTPGFVDVVVATELLEAGRVIEQGLVSPELTTLIASPHRSYTIEERSAMGDERVPSARILEAIGKIAARPIVFDMAETAARAQAIVSSVVFGAIAAAGVLPLSRDRFVAVLEKSGVAVEANLRGFDAAFEAVAGASQGGAAAPKPPGSRTLPAEVDDMVGHGVKRLAEYQDAAHAERYLQFVDRISDAEAAARQPVLAWTVTREAARYLALMMSWEDIIRVSALKTRRERWDRIRSENPTGEKDVLQVTEFLKPGLEEFASLLPRRLGRWVVEAASRRGRLDAFNVGLRLRTTSVTGFLLMRLIAGLRFWRPRSFRFHQEMAVISDWVDLVVASMAIDPVFAAEVVECARIRKGYGATHRRGAANFAAIMDHVVRPAIAARRSEAGLVAKLRGIALADPEGTALIEAVEPLRAAWPGKTAECGGNGR